MPIVPPLWVVPGPRTFAPGRYHLRCASPGAAALLRLALPGVAFEEARTADCLIAHLTAHEAEQCAALADLTALVPAAW